MIRHLMIGIAALAVATLSAAPQPNPRLVTAIDAVRAIDNHAHVVAPDAEHDTAYDALRCDTLPSGNTSAPPANTHVDPDLQAAWMALYGFSGDSVSDAELQSWRQKQRAVRDKLGAGYFAWVAEQARLDVVLANRVSMAPGLDAAHFRWVPYDDALLFPLDNATGRAQSPDRNVLFGATEQILHSYMSAAGVTARPATLDSYIERVVAPTLQSQKDHGAVAIKFEAAYLRSLDFAPAAHDAAASAYARGVVGTTTGAEYKLIQDFLFRDIAARAGRLGLVIHVHTGIGCGEYFDARGADPMLLESVLNDPALRTARFVLLHGGTPFDRHNLGLMTKPNAWLDASLLELLFSPPELARIMRPWLETSPERVLFGTDAGPFGPGEGWEETTWMGSRRARRALAIALTDMVSDGVVTETRAIEIARGVLRENARELYGWR